MAQSRRVKARNQAVFTCLTAVAYLQRIREASGRLSACQRGFDAMQSSLDLAQPIARDLAPLTILLDDFLGRAPNEIRVGELLVDALALPSLGVLLLDETGALNRKINEPE